MNYAKEIIIPKTEGVFRTIFLYVGQGEATLLVIPDGSSWKYMLIDINSDRKNGGIDIVKLLLEKDVMINDVSNLGWTALMEACMDGFTVIAELLISEGADVNMKTAVDATALYFASYEGHIDIVKLLLEKGADPTVEVDTSSYDYEQTDTALTVAIQQGHEEIVSLLKKAMNL